MPREDRMRSLSLLDRETVRSGENGSVGIGAELFGMNVINIEGREAEMPGHQREQAEEPDDKRRRGQEEGTDAEPGVETGVPPKPPSSGTGNLGIGTGDKDAVETESPSGAPCKEAGKTPRAEPEMMPRMEAPYTGSPAADRRPVPADTDPPFYRPAETGAAYSGEPETVRFSGSQAGRAVRQATPEPVVYGQRTETARLQEPAFFQEYPYRTPAAQKPGISYRYPRLAQPEPIQKIARRIISVYSPKGGVGKSTISKELAVAFAMNAVQGSPFFIPAVRLSAISSHTAAASISWRGRGIRRRLNL